MRDYGKWFVAAGIMAAILAPMRAEAIYKSDTDTKSNVLDYVENNRRKARENKLSEEQLQLMEDAKEMTRNLRRPIDPSKPKPMALEGDDMYYDQTTGDVYARGAVRATSIDFRRFETEEARGNLQKEEIRVDDKAHMLQLTPGQARVTLDGYRLVYHYGKQQGTMGEARGKVGNYYVYGRRFEFYPDKIYIFDGWQTRCNAKNPDYRVSGDIIEVYPGNEILVYQAKFWIKDKILYTKDHHRIDISPDAEQMPHLPRAGYDSDNHFWVADRFSVSPWPRVEAYADLRFYARHGFRNVYGIGWTNAGNTVSLEYGYYEDSNNNWVKKEPTFKYQYTHRLGKLPFTYTLDFEKGRWTQVKEFKPSYTSTHTYYGVTLTPFPLKLGGSPSWRLNTSLTYSITTESLNHSTVKGFSWNAMMLKDFGEALTLYAGYSYSQSTTQNSLFDYGLDSYSNRVDIGASIRLTPKDRLVIGRAIDAKKGEIMDIDYYWFHDIHCAQLVVRRRSKRDRWNVTLEFQPW